MTTRFLGGKVGSKQPTRAPQPFLSGSVMVRMVGCGRVVGGELWSVRHSYCAAYLLPRLATIARVIYILGMPSVDLRIPAVPREQLVIAVEALAEIASERNTLPAPAFAEKALIEVLRIETRAA